MLKSLVAGLCFLSLGNLGGVLAEIPSGEVQAPKAAEEVAIQIGPNPEELTEEEKIEHEEYVKAYKEWEEMAAKKEKEMARYYEVHADRLGITNQMHLQQSKTQDDLLFSTEDQVDQLTDLTFDRYIHADKTEKGRRVLVFFYAPWCHHSRDSKAAVIEAAMALDEPDVDLGSVAVHDCHANPMVCQNQQIQGLPTLRYFVNGVHDRDYLGPRTAEGIMSFMEVPDAPPGPPPPPPAAEPFSTVPTEVVALGDSDQVEGEREFHKFMSEEEAVLVFFYSPNCPHSKAAKPDFIKGAELLKGTDANAKFAAVDCNSQEKLCSDFGINGLPTYKYFSSGEESQQKKVVEYVSYRTGPALVDFITNPNSIIPPPPPMPSFWTRAPKEEL